MLALVPGRGRILKLGVLVPVYKLLRVWLRLGRLSRCATAYAAGLKSHFFGGDALEAAGLQLGDMSTLECSFSPRLVTV